MVPLPQKSFMRRNRAESLLYHQSYNKRRGPAHVSRPPLFPFSQRKRPFGKPFLYNIPAGTG